jgi:hypothetical protein
VRRRTQPARNDRRVRISVVLVPRTGMTRHNLAAVAHHAARVARDIARARSPHKGAALHGTRRDRKNKK